MVTFCKIGVRSEKNWEMNNPIYFADNKFITHFITHLWYDRWVIKQVITCKRRRKIWIGFNRLLKNFVHMILNGNSSNLKKTGLKLMNWANIYPHYQIVLQ